jgi:hypothetical protein
MKFYKKSSLFLSHLDLRVFDMVLDQMARGMLEKYIDRVIRGIPYLMSRFRKKDVKDILQYGNEEDFLYGTVYGAIVWGYTDQFQILFQRKPTQEEVFEMQTIIVKRMREVKDAIFKAG